MGLDVTNKDTLVIYRRFLLIEKIKDIPVSYHGHRYWFDNKGIYNKYSDRNDKNRINDTEGNKYYGPIIISYPNNEYKTFFPESISYHLFWEKQATQEICHIYEENSEVVGENKYIYKSTKYYI